jgi:hypothetical protein
MPLASSARASTPPPAQQRARASNSPARHATPPSANRQHSGGKTVTEKIEAAQRRRLESERKGENSRAPKKRDEPLAALSAAKAAAEKEAAWRNGAPARAEEVKANRMAQLAEIRAEEEGAKARAAAAKAAAQVRAAEAAAEAARAAAAVQAAEEAAARRRAEEEAKDPYRVIGGGGGECADEGSAGGQPPPPPPQKPLSSATHAPGASTENGNTLGTRPVVRQSKLYREKESGNAMKAAMGHDSLQWDTEKLQGIFEGQGVYNASSEKIEFKDMRTSPRASSARGVKLQPPRNKSQSPRRQQQLPPPPMPASERSDATADMPLPPLVPTTPLERMILVKGLLDDGLLTPAEYEAKRLAILDEI